MKRCCRHMRRHSRRSIRRTAFIASTPDSAPSVLPILVHTVDRSRLLAWRARTLHWPPQRPSCRDETLSCPPGTRALITLETFSMTDFSKLALRGAGPVQRKLSAFFNVVRTRVRPPTARPQIIFGEESE